MRFQHSVSCAALAMAGALVSPVAYAQQSNVVVGPSTTISPASANVLNLLSPFLSLNATAVGRTTLSTNLSQAVATNNSAPLGLQQLAESDENLPGAISNTITLANGMKMTVGTAANLGGGLPTQATPMGGNVVPMQPVGGLGAVLGAAYANGINTGITGTGATATNNGPLSNVATLLNNAYTNFTSPNLGVAKNYFANGGANNTSSTAGGVTTYTTSPAVAPAGYTLPTANGLPNRANSVYDVAYGVTNGQPGQDVFGSSRPIQVAPTKLNFFDPTALGGLATNPSFPSGHTTYGYTDGILLAMLVPQEYQSMLYRASAYGNSRIVLGVHYPLDIIAGRALASYDLSQALTNPLYINNGTTTGGTGVNLPANFTAAQAQITPYLNAAAAGAGCGISVATCANSAANTANDPYVANAANAALYTSNLTYGLPTLTFAQAPREAAPAGGPDASILLAPIYGGSTTFSAAIAPNGGLNGTLSTTTINQIIVNTETTALAAFYGTTLSYWSRIDLAAAAGYFSGVTGTLSLQPTDVVTVPVTIASGGTLAANGRLTGATVVQSQGTLAGSGTVANVTVNAGGTLAPGSLEAQTALKAGTANVAGTRLAVNGNVVLQPGSTLAIFATPTQSTSVAATGTATITGSNLKVVAGPGRYVVDPTILTATGGVVGTFASVSDNLPFLRAVVSYAPTSVNLGFAPDGNALVSTAQTSNQRNFARAFVNAADISPNNALVRDVFNLKSAGEARALFNSLTGEGIAASQNVAQRSTQLFTSSILDQTTFFGPAGGGNSITLVAPIRELADLPTRGAIPVAPIVPERTWRAWATGFGGTEDIHGNAALGTAAQQNTLYGGALGVDYQFAPNNLVGVAVGGSDGDFSVPGRSTSGSTTGGHVAIYDLATFGHYYAAATGSFSYYNNRTTRTAGGFGGIASETEKGNFDSYEFRTHLEAGRHFDAVWNGISVTPFAAVEAADLHSNGFGETSVSGPGLLRLAVQDQSAASVPTFLGARFQRATNFGGMVLTPTLQAAWVHEFAPYRSQVAGIADLPGSTFLVDGARPARDAAQVKAGGELALGPNSVLFATFDGEFSGVNQLYAGKGGFRFTW
jgi:subtilase-type serine protease